MSWQLLWFKRDLRVQDHPALAAFCQTIKEQGGLPLAFYATEPSWWQQPDMSWRQAQFVEDSLLELQPLLAAQGIPFVVVDGEVVPFLQKLAAVNPIAHLFSHQETGNAWTFQRDVAVASFCTQSQIEWMQPIQHPIKRAGINRDTYDEFAYAFWSQPLCRVPDAIADELGDKSWQMLANVEGLISGNDLTQRLRNEGILSARRYDWEHKGLFQRGGRSRGDLCLQRILQRNAENYLQTVAKPEQGAKFSSRLSPHLAWGTLSIREVMQQARARLAQVSDKRNLRAFVSRLHWQSHFMQKLEAEAEMEFHCLHPMYEQVRVWSPEAQQRFEAWALGQTGIPFVDACMRSLRYCGWLPFRMRAMLMSFASYQLWLPWQKTAPYLASLFTDYEPGIHYSQVQMQSGVTGINQMRVYNPVKQGLDHDPKGRFILQFCPELQGLPLEYIHEPWQLSQEQQHRFGVVLTQDYPEPIVEHESAARSAKKAMAAVRQQSQHREISQGVFVKHGSRLRPAQRQGGRVRKTGKTNPVIEQAKQLRKNQMELF